MNRTVKRESRKRPFLQLRQLEPQPQLPINILRAESSVVPQLFRRQLQRVLQPLHQMKFAEYLAEEYNG